MLRWDDYGEAEISCQRKREFAHSNQADFLQSASVSEKDRGSVSSNGLSSGFLRKWWATLESNQAWVTPAELQSAAAPCSPSPVRGSALGRPVNRGVDTDQAGARQQENLP